MSFVENITISEPASGSDSFSVRIQFGLSEAQAKERMPKLSKWFMSTCVDDPEAFEKELENTKIEFVPMQNSNYFEMKIIGEQKHHVRQTWVSGLDVLSVDESKKHIVYHEYVRDTPVTRAIVAEIYKISKDKEYEQRLLSTYELGSYLESLIICLHSHWD